MNSPYLTLWQTYLIKAGFIQDHPLKHNVLAAFLKDFRRLVATSATEQESNPPFLRTFFCQAQPNPSSTWVELALFSLSPAYGLHNIAYGLQKLAYIRAAQNWETNINSLLPCSKCLGQPQLQLSLAEFCPSLSFIYLHSQSTPHLRKFVLKNNIWSTPDIFLTNAFINIWSTPDIFFPIAFSIIWSTPDFFLSMTFINIWSTPDINKCIWRKNIWSTPDTNECICQKNIWSTPDIKKVIEKKNIWSTPDHASGVDIFTCAGRLYNCLNIHTAIVFN